MPWTWKRKTALCFLVLPLVVFFPLMYWAFHLAGGWYVTFDLEPEHRHHHLAEMFVLDFIALTSITTFSSLLLLFLDKYKPRLTGCLLIPATILALLGLGLLAITVDSYYRYS